MANQRRIWMDPKVRAERQPPAERAMGRPMEFDDAPPPARAERATRKRQAKKAAT